ncbi:mutS protein homolog 5-like isoform X3 [Stegodyphus dumicola]|uniref:mutS protein homolog 5-like isoform X3 n=1 Tax=Stegodyphus dumicola TaxID=202533 RepID=UPI0015B2489A|nr:mutS protein homolog 5-like isoform X3 [Stegodyphus dumicola]
MNNSENSSTSSDCMNVNDVHILVDTEEDEIPQVILSVIWQANKLGAAYYNIDTSKLYLVNDHLDPAPHFTILSTLLKQTEPTYVVTSARTDEKFVSALKEMFLQQNSAQRRSESSIFSNILSDENEKLHLLPSIEFAYEVGKHRLKNLNFPNVPPDMNDIEKTIYFSSLIDFTNTCMVKAAGGLLKTIERSPLGLSLDKLKILSVSTLSLKNLVNIDENSYRALQIFQEERHPSVYKNTFGIKEGLSLYGICNKCKSGIGKKELKRWFLLPTNDVNLIQERQEAIKYFILAKNKDVMTALQDSLKFIKFLPRLLSRMKNAQATLNDWQALYRTSYHAVLIGDICRSRNSDLKIFKEIGETFSTDLFRIASLLDKIIDFQEYEKQNHFVVKPGVDSELDKMKRTYNGLPDFMTQVAYQELQELSEDIQKCSVIYLPQLGYLLAVPVTEQMKKTKNYTIPNLRFMFILNDVAHYKTANTKKLDSLLGDTLCDIYDKETQIMHKLQNAVLEVEHIFNAVMEYSAKLDCLIALAVISLEYNWTQPEITADGYFAIVKGRHPLQELCVESFVPNDTFSGKHESKIKILTGPNSSGKSIYLKQIALIAYMAHLGSFVPAQKAIIPVLDGIFSCIYAAESVSINLSSFLITLNQFSYALNTSTKNSLVIVDEFGKDTDTDSSLALLTASVKFWNEKGLESPHVFLATHFLSLSTAFCHCPGIKFQVK